MAVMLGDISYPVPPEKLGNAADLTQWIKEKIVDYRRQHTEMPSGAAVMVACGFDATFSPNDFPGAQIFGSWVIGPGYTIFPYADLTPGTVLLGYQDPNSSLE